MESESVYRNIPLSALFATLGVLFPLLFHFIGLGSMFLPMFLPLTMAATLLPPAFAVSIAIITPLCSLFFTGMPPLYPPILLMVLVELVTLSLITSILYVRKKWSIWITLCIACLADRIILYGFILFFAEMLDFPEKFYSITVVFYGIPGIILIFLVVPATLKFLRRSYPEIFSSVYSRESE